MNKRVREYKNVFTWLAPPETFGEITVIDITKAKNEKEHEKLVVEWAKVAWNSWREHHAIIESYLKSIDYD